MGKFGFLQAGPEALYIDVDTTQAIDKLDEVNDKIEDTKDKLTQVLDDVDKKTQTSFNAVMGMMRAAYSGITAVVRIGGGTVSRVFATIISGALGATTVLYPVLQAALTTGLASLNPYQVAMAIAGMAELGISIAAIVAAQGNQTEINQKLSAGLSAVNSIQMFIGSMNFL